MYHIAGKELIKEVSLFQRIFEAIVALILTLFVHELIHASAMKLFSKGEVKIKLIKMKAGGFGFTTILQGNLEKWQKFIMLILPFVILTVLTTILFIKGDYLFFYLVAVINCAGSYFDLLDAILIFENIKGDKYVKEQ